MKLVIGGAYQGKKAYASEKYHIREEEWVDGSQCSIEELYEGKAVYDFHQLIRKNENIVHRIDELCEKNSRIIIIANEVGAGVVPMSAEERAWRERCGRVCTRLAQEADEVVRVCCGIGYKIKG